MKDYPLPDCAVGIWFDGNGISVRLPPEPGKERGHIIYLTADQNGMANLLVILRERAKGNRRFGTPGSPTQSMVPGLRIDQIKAVIEAARRRKRAEAEARIPTVIRLEDLL